MAFDLREILNSVFEPIIARVSHEVAGGIGELVTAPIPPEKRKISFARFRETRISSENVINLSNGDFFSYFKCDQDHYLCLSIQYMSKSDVERITQILEEYLCVEHELEECFYIHMAHALKDIYTIKMSLDNNSMIETLGLGVREKEPGYTGHEISELIDVYSPLLIFSVDKNSALLTKDNWFLASLLALNCESIKSKVVDAEIIHHASKLFDLGTVNLENIYLSLTAVHHKHIFIEVYRCLEAIYYLPCMLDLKSKIQAPVDAFDLARYVAKSLSWREKERESINALLKDIPYDIIETSGINSLPFVISLSPEDTVSFKVKLSNVIYNIRNQSVHQEDYEEVERININTKAWVVISKFVYMVVAHLYNKYSADIKVYNCRFSFVDA